MPAYHKGKSTNETMFRMVCRRKERDKFTEILFEQSNYLFKEDVREIFQFVRHNCYDLFKLFYECVSVSLKGGKLENDWNRN